MTSSDTYPRLMAELDRLLAADLTVEEAREVRTTVEKGLYARSVPTGDYQVSLVIEICLDALETLSQIPRTRAS